MEKPIKDYSKKELHDLLYREPTKIKVEGINLTYEGLIPKIQKSMLAKDPESMQPHIRAFVERAITFGQCPECGGTRLSAAAPDQSRTPRRGARLLLWEPLYGAVAMRAGPQSRAGRGGKRSDGQYRELQLGAL